MHHLLRQHRQVIKADFMLGHDPTKNRQAGTGAARAPTSPLRAGSMLTSPVGGPRAAYSTAAACCRREGERRASASAVPWPPAAPADNELDPPDNELDPPLALALELEEADEEAEAADAMWRRMGSSCAMEPISSMEARAAVCKRSEEGVEHGLGRKEGRG